MVTTAAISLGRRLARGLQNDVSNFLAIVSGPASTPPGLYKYQANPSAGTRRIHLRIEEDGHGVLFVDANDVIHLNRTAATMAKMALDGTNFTQARSNLVARLGSTDTPRVDSELGQIFTMVDHLQNSIEGCLTCTINGLERAPLFSTRARAPYKADLALTYGCNNECPHCYNEPDRFDMVSLRKEKWFDVLDRLYDIGVPHVIFTGGEATLHPDFPEIVRYADSLGLITGLNTNGRRIAHRSYMQALANAGLNHVQITLGSCRPEIHDMMMGAASFQQTVRGIENALASNVHVITNTTIMRCNAENVEQIIDFLHTIGIRTFAMNGMIYSGGGFADPNAIAEEAMPAILIRIRDYASEKRMRFLWYTPTEYCRMSPVELEIGAKRCNAGEYSICIEPNGDVLPCQSYYASAGNILRDPWSQIWHGELFRTFRDREADPRWAGLPEKCWECPDLALCGGGCRIEREARDGHRTGNVGGSCSSCSGFKPPQGSISKAVRSTGRASPIIGLNTIASAPNRNC